MTQVEFKILETVLSELKSIRTGMPNGELKQILESQREMKEDISELKYTLLNPEDGVIVKVNKNTDFRKSSEKKSDEYHQLIKDLEDLKGWKQTVIKVLWILFGAVVTILTKVFFYTTTGTTL
jgi:predicted RNA-binding protein with EMAP domain